MWFALFPALPKGLRSGPDVLASVFVVVWALSGPFFHYSDTWQLVINTGTTIITFLMVFVIQNSQNRDTMAIHSKLDEILRSLDNASNHLVGLEHKSEAEIEAIRDAIELDCKSGEG
jgi:low affinity Fe/Cu permease